MTDPQTPPSDPNAPVEPIKIKAPDGTTLQFPGTMSMGQIKDVMRRKYGAGKPAAPAASKPAAPAAPAAPPFSGALSPSSPSASPSSASPSGSVSAGQVVGPDRKVLGANYLSQADQLNKARDQYERFMAKAEYAKKERRAAADEMRMPNNLNEIVAIEAKYKDPKMVEYGRKLKAVVGEYERRNEEYTSSLMKDVENHSKSLASDSAFYEDDGAGGLQVNDEAVRNAAIEYSKEAGLSGTMGEEAVAGMMRRTIEGKIAGDKIEKVFGPKREKLVAGGVEAVAPEIRAKASAAAQEVNGRYQQMVDRELEPLRNEYGAFASQMNLKMDAIRSTGEAQAKQLNEAYQRGEITEQQATAEFESLNAQMQQQAAAVEKENKDLYAKLLGASNKIHSRYNGQWKAEMDAIEKASQEQLAKVLTNDPELNKKLAEAWEDSAQEVAAADQKRIGAAWDLKKISANPMAQAGELFMRRFLSTFGGELKSFAPGDGIGMMWSLGDKMEHMDALPAMKTGEFSDLLDLNNASQLSGSLTGTMIPSVVAGAGTAIFTEGLGLGAGTGLVASRAAAWWMETKTVSERAKRDMLDRTGDQVAAQKAYDDTFKSQVDLAPVYALASAPFATGPLSRLPTMARSIGAEFVEEYPIEVAQGVVEGNVSLGLEPWDGLGDAVNPFSAGGEEEDKRAADARKRLKETAVALGPIGLLGGAGAVNVKSDAQRWLESNEVKSAIQSANKSYIDNYVAQMASEGAKSLPGAVIDGLYAAGEIDQFRYEELKDVAARATSHADAASRMGLGKQQQVAYTQAALATDRMRVEANATADITEKAAMNELLKQSESSLKEFLSSKDGSFVKITLPDGDVLYQTADQANELLDDPAFVAAMAASPGSAMYVVGAGIDGEVGSRVKGFMNEMKRYRSKPTEEGSAGASVPEEGASGEAAEPTEPFTPLSGALVSGDALALEAQSGFMEAFARTNEDGGAERKFDRRAVKKFEKQAVRVARALKGLGVKVYVHYTPESFADATGSAESGGAHIGKDKAIHLNAAVAADRWWSAPADDRVYAAGSVPYHEGLHAAILQAVGTSEKADDVVMAMANNIATNPNIIRALAPFLASYTKGNPILDENGEVSDPVVAHEIVAELFAHIASDPKSITGRARQAIIDLINEVLASLGVGITLDINDQTEFADLAKKLSDAFRSGRELVIKPSAERAESEGGEGAQFARLAARTPREPKSQYDHTKAAAEPHGVNMDIVPDKLKQTWVSHLAKIPGMRMGNGSADTKLKRAIEHMVNNLLALHDSFDETVRDLAKEWYVGANKVATEWADKYGVTLAQSAGIIAALSPQKDWFTNMSLAERVMDFAANHRDSVWDGKMAQRAAELREKYAGEIESAKGALERNPESKAAADRLRANTRAVTSLDAAIPRISGMAYADIASLNDKAWFLRIWDEANNDPSFNEYLPAGEKIDIRRNKPKKPTKKNPNPIGDPSRIAWQSYDLIAAAIDIAENGESIEKVSENIGEAHKVRNFYNNIFNPQDVDFTTIDTHAVAAALMLPLSSKSPYVGAAFGSGKDAESGHVGVYAVYQRAYEIAASMRGIQPREMQSIAWEAVRGLFEKTQKQADSKASTKKNKDGSERKRAVTNAAEKAWNTMASDPNAARAAIMAAYGGVSNPEWYKGRQAPVAAEPSPAVQFSRKVATQDDFKKGALAGILEKHDWAVLTAENPRAERIPQEENDARMVELKADLDAIGAEHKPLQGKYGNWENSLAITGITEAQAVELGKKYDQESILTRKGLLYPDGTYYPATSARELDGTPEELAKDPENMFSVVDGQPFEVVIDFSEKLQSGAGSQFSRAPTPSEVESIRSGADFVFSQHGDGLSKIGSKEQYEEYLSSVYPASSDKNVYYNGGAKGVFSAKDWRHGGNARGKNFGDAIHLAGNRIDAKQYAERYGGVTLAAVVDVRNPAFTDLRSSMGLGDSFSASATALGKPDADAIYNLEYVDRDNWSVSPRGVSTYAGPVDDTGMPSRQEVHARDAARQQVAISDKSKVLILGSDEDLDGFSAFVSDRKKGEAQFSRKATKGNNLVPRNMQQHLTDDGKGNYVFFHTGPKNLKGGVINPAFFGKGATKDNRYNPVMNYYTKPDQGESTVKGDVSYAVVIPKWKVYPLTTDPLNLFDEAEANFRKKFGPRQAFNATRQADFIGPLAEAAGFDMMIAGWGIHPVRGESGKALAPDTKATAKYEKQQLKDLTAVKDPYYEKLMAKARKEQEKRGAQFSRKSAIDSAMPRIDSFNGLGLRRVAVDLRVSAASAFADAPFTMEPGVRDVKLSDIDLQGSDLMRSAAEEGRIANLAAEIRKSGMIEPLFVAVRSDGSAYLAEGQHRARALMSMGFDSIPARVAVEREIADGQFARKAPDRTSAAYNFGFASGATAGEIFGRKEERKAARKEREKLEAQLTTAIAARDQARAESIQRRLDAMAKVRELKESFREKMKEAAMQHRWDEVMKIAGAEIAAEIRGQKKGRQEGQAELRKEMKLVAGIVSGIVNNMPYPLSKRQQDQMIRAAGRIATAGDLAKFQDLADRLMEDADYADKLEAATTARKNVKSALATATKGRRISSNQVLMTKDFLSMDPRSVDDLDTYLDLATRLEGDVKGARATETGLVTNAQLSVTQAELTQFVDDEKAAQAEAIREALMAQYEQFLLSSGYASMQNGKLVYDQAAAGGFTIEELDALLRHGAAGATTQPLVSSAQKRLDVMRQFMDARLRGWNPKAAWGGSHTFSKDDQAHIDAISRANVADLNMTELLKIHTVIEGIEKNGDMSDVGNAASIILANEAKAEVMAVDVESDLNKFVSSVTNLAGNMERIAKGVVETAAHLRKVTWIDALLNKTSASHLRAVKWSRDIQEMEKVFGIKPSDDTIKNRALMATYSIVRQHYGGNRLEQWEDFSEAKKQVETDINNLKNLTKPTDEQRALLDALESAYSSILAGSNSAQEVEAKMAAVAPKQKRLADWVTQEFNARVQRKLMESAVKDNNMQPAEIYNYYRRKWNRLDARTPPPDPNANNPLLARVFGRTGAGTSPVGSKKERVGRPAEINGTYAQEYDFIKNVIDSFAESDWDASTAHERNVLSKLLQDKEFAGHLGDGFEVFRRAVELAVDEYRGQWIDKDPGIELAHRVLNRAAKFSALRALVSPSQWLKQATPLVNAAVVLGKDSGLLFKSIPNSHRLHEKFMIGSRKDIVGGFEKHRNKVERTAAKMDGESALKYLAREAGNFAASASDKAFSWSIATIDAVTASRSWDAFYQKYLKDNLSDADFAARDWDNEWLNPSEEAAAYANQMIERSQGANMAETMAPMYKDTRARGLVQILMPYSSFSVNMRTRIARDVKMLRTGTADDKALALKSLIGTAAESAVFNAVRMGLSIYVVKMAAEALKDMLLGDDPEDENDKKRTSATPEELLGGVVRDMFWSGLPGAATAGLDAAANALWREISPVGRDGKPADNLYWTPRPGDDPVANYLSYLGTYGQAGAAMWGMGEKAIELMDDDYVVRRGGFAGDLSPRQWSDFREAGGRKPGMPMVVPAPEGKEYDRNAIVLASLAIDLASVLGVSVAELNNINRQIYNEVKKQERLHLGGQQGDYIVKPNPRSSSYRRE